ncbi:MAG: helix-turn-helix domain-containing protein [Spirochaetaceae bacterium]
MSRYIGKTKAIADETRFRLLRVLIEADTPLCVAELTDILRKPQYAVSRALAQLARADLVEEIRRGKLRFYLPSEEPFNKRLFDLVVSVPADDSLWLYDRDRLRWRLELREEGDCVVTYTAGYVPKEYKQTKEAEMDPQEKRKVLFICVHNTARSQIAEAYLRQLAGDLFEVESAGLTPGTLNPYVVEAMRQDGIDISHKVPQSVFDLYKEGRTYTYVITVCSREAEEGCPVFPGPVRRLSWPFPDPSRFEGSEEDILQKTIEVRNVIKEEVRQFVEHYRTSQTAAQADVQ